MRHAVMISTLAVGVLVSAGQAPAEVPLEGYFIGRRSCEAYQSMRKGTNPGNVTIVVDRAYDLFAKNKEDATHYLIQIDGVQPGRRWVAVGCGEHVVPADENMPWLGDDDDNNDDGVTVGAASHILAVSWQPAFCEGHQGKIECANQTADRFDANNLALHGLWPQPRGNDYCGVSAQDRDKSGDRRWDELSALDLSTEVRDELNQVMPGTQSFLQRHEWIKHGTCHSATAEEYFRDSLALMRQLNQSAVRDFLAANIGHKVTTEDLRGKFDESFGVGSGQRVRVACTRDGDRRLIGELTIGLRGDIDDDANLGALMLAARSTSAGCNEGIVDPALFQ